MAKKKPKESAACMLRGEASTAINWFDRLSSDVRVEMLEIRRQYHIDRLGNKTIVFVFEWCKEHLGISPSKTTFGEWLHRKDEDDETR